MNTVEEWRAVPGFEGLYEISSFGNVKALPRFHNNDGCGYIQKERIMSLNKWGKYQRVALRKDRKYTYLAIHRLVAEVFIENVDNKPCVNHIDNNPENNRVENLEWCTYQENALHANRVAKVCTGMTGKHHSKESRELISKGHKGLRPTNAAFTTEEAKDIKKRKQAGEKRKSVYEDYKSKITEGGFQNIWYGRTYKEVSI